MYVNKKQKGMFMKKHSSIFFKITTLAVLLTSMIGGAFAQTPSDEGTHNVTVASSCGSYTWSANGVSYHASGVYTHAYENELGYASVDTLKLTIKPMPNVEVEGNDTVCFGVISGLKATGATTYWWWHTSNGMAEPINSVPKDSITVTLTEVDTFIVVGTNSYGCQATDTFPVLVLPLPSVVAHAHTSRICRGYSVTLTAAGANDYIWRPGNLFGQPVEAWPKRTTTYTVTGYDFFGCKNTASVTVEVEGVEITADKTKMCDGDTATLTASGAGAYSWELDDGTYTEEDWQSSESIRVTRPGTYIVTGIGHGMGCTSKDTVTITVYDLPEVRIMGPEVVNGGDTICKGDTAMLIANGADVYSWTIESTVVHADTIMVFPTVNKKYVLLGEDTLTKCKVKDSVEVVVHALPEVKITGPNVVNGQDTICKGDTTVLVGEGAKYYSWSESYVWTNSMETKDSIKISPVANISYIVTGTDTNKCKAKDTVNVVVNALPEVRITGPNVVNGQDTICKGDTTMLVGEGAKYYTWNEPYIWTSSVDTKDSIKISPKVNIKYIVTGTDTNKCKAKDTVNIVVHALPEVRITGPDVVDGQDTICKGDTTMLIGEGAKYYSWNKSYIWTSSVDTKDSIKISPKVDVKYIVTGTDTNKCKAKDTVNVVVLKLPDVKIDGPGVVDGRDTICKGDTAMLFGDGADSYVWMLGFIPSFEDTVLVHPKVNIDYYVVGTDSNGCKAADTVKMVVLELPEVKITGPHVVDGRDTLCKGDTDTLMAEGADTYVWMLGFIPSFEDTIEVSPTYNVDYFLVGTDTNGCKAKDTVKMVVNTLPEVSITGPTVVNGRDTLCAGDTSMYIATGAKFYDWVEVNRGESYIWTSSVERKDTILISPPGSTLKYIVTGTDTNKCKSKDTVDVIVYPKPEASIRGEDEVCKGNSITLETMVSMGWRVDKYKWDTGEEDANIIITPDEDKEYKVTVTDEHGCTATSTKSVTVHGLPHVGLDASPDNVCKGERVTLTASGADTYEWSPSGTGNQIMVNPTENTDYTVTGTDDNGCTASVTKRVTVNDRPEINITSTSGTDEVCEGNPYGIQLNAFGASTYSWTTIPAGATAPVVVSTGSSYIFVSSEDISVPTEYTFTVQGTVDGSDCPGVGSKTIKVYPMPEIHISGDTLICESGGTGTSLNASGVGVNPDRYRWIGGHTGYTYHVNPSRNTSYTVFGENDHGCTGSASITVRVRKGEGENVEHTECEKYLWKGEEYTESGTYYHATNDDYGCHCFDTLQLTINYGSHRVEPVDEMDSYTWHKTGSTYYQSGTYVYYYENEDGCPSADTLKLHLSHDVLDNFCISAGMVRRESCDPGNDGIVKVYIPQFLQDDCDILWKLGGGETSSSEEVGGLSKGTYTVKVTSRTCSDVVYFEDRVKLTREGGCDDDDDDDDGDNGAPTVSISGPTDVNAGCDQMPTCTYYISISGGTPPYSISGDALTIRYTPPVGHSVLSRTVTDANGKSGKGSLDIYGQKEKCSVDPNEITGPSGYSEERRFVNGTDRMNYKIDFENDPDFATAPATRVKVTYDVPAEQNLASFRLGEFGFGSFIYTVPSNVTSYYQRIDVSDSLGVWVDVTAGMDFMNNQLFWIFQSIDPATGAEPANSQMGFLSVNDSVGHGEGYVTYYISPKNTVVTGDTVSAEALIIFDDNAPINTNVWTNTFDVVAPTSTLIAEMNEQDSLYCNFTFEAQDDANGSGVKEIEVFVSMNNGTYRSLGTAHPDSSLSYTLENGMYYQFMSIATDNVGNVEPFKAQADTVVNYNTAPMELLLAGNSFYEYDPRNTYIGTFTTVDDDMSQPFVYTLVSGEGDNDNALFTIVGNTIRTDTSFVCSRELEYYVRVRTTDFGGLYYERSFKLNEIRQHITPTVNLSRMICSGESVDFFGQMLTETGDYTQTLHTSEGCDSIVNLNLTVNPSYHAGAIDTVVCEQFVWNDSVYTVSDVISYTYVLPTGCDSTVTYNLTVNHSTEGVDEQIACDSFTWINDSTYTVSTNTPTVTLTNAAGCDSIVTLHLTINHSTEGVDEQIACNSFTWIDDSTYTVSTNTPTVTLTNAAGCDSVVILHLTINQSTEGVDEQIACDSFTWINDSTYTESTNTPTVTLTNAAGCDSVVTLHLAVNYSTEGIDEQIACDSYTWIDDITYTESTNTPTVTLTNAAGCDSVVTLHLTINHSTEGIDEQIACDNYTWINDSTYTVSTNTPTVTLTNAAGCDSVVTLHLTINHSTEGVDEQIACDSYTWIDDITYTESTNTPTVTLTNAAGCDSVVTLHLTVNYGTHNVYDTVVCESYEWHGAVYTVSGTYTYTYEETNADGCVAVDTLHLIVNYGMEFVDEQVACESFTWINDSTYTESTNIPTVTLTNAAGCDSVVTLHLTINHPTTGIDLQEACESYTWIDGVTYTASTTTPTFTIEGGAANGCDSTVTLHLTINQPTTGIDEQVACESYIWIDGVTYTASTNTPTYTYAGGAANGCDSTVTLHLTINRPTTGIDEQVACESYTWIDGVTYTASTSTPTYTYAGGAANGCDSTVTLHLTINQPTTGIDEQVACESYTWIDGVTYTASTTTPTYTIEGGAANGCDSIVTLHLTINQPVTELVEVTACESYTWIDGVTYTASTNTPTFTIVGGAANGCDSTVTLHLTINQPTTSIEEQVACETFTWIDGVTYTASTTTPTFTIEGGAANGCDSTVTLHLTINQPVTELVEVTACESYTWIDGVTYTASTSTPTYTYAGGAANGCDSIVTLHLTINQSTMGVDYQEACDSLQWIDGVTYYESTSDVNVPTFTLTNAAGCDSVVTLNLSLNHSVTVDYYLTISDDDLPFTYGDTTFLPGTVQSGDYTIVLETADGCDSVVTLHLTVTGINDYLMNVEMNVYPNPTNNRVNVQLIMNNAQLGDVDIQLYDMYGKWLKTWKATGETTVIDLSSYAASVYFIKAVDGQRMIGIRKVVKE